MATAFQANAFQLNSFQIDDGGVTPPVVTPTPTNAGAGGFGPAFPSKRRGRREIQIPDTPANREMVAETETERASVEIPQVKAPPILDQKGATLAALIEAEGIAADAQAARAMEIRKQQQLQRQKLLDDDEAVLIMMLLM